MALYQVDQKQVVFNKPTLANWLKGLTTIPTAVPFDGMKIGAYKNNITPTPTTAFADFTECDFSGYSYLTGAFGLPHEPNASQGGVLLRAAYGPTTVDPFVANTVYGLFGGNTGKTDWYWACRFTTPITVATIYDYAYIFVELGVSYLLQTDYQSNF